MAIYTTFFLAEPEALCGGFPGWKPALPRAVHREFRNPFTQELVAMETREPEWSAEEEKLADRQYRVLAGQGSYEEHLEGRLPPFVRAVEHWAAKGLTNIELEELLGAIGIPATLESPIYSPPSWGSVLFEFPSNFIPTLIANDPGAVATRWAAAMSTPDHTHSVDGTKLSDGWTVDDASQILTRVLQLALQATADQRMYLLIEA